MRQEKQDYIASESGFWYYYNNKIDNDTLTTPDFGDVINYNYNVKNINGNLIYSTEEIKTQTYAMDKEELFTGLREGLKLMKSGETVTFLFPSQKAYGYYGDENKIGSNVPLICEVTINSITQNQTP
jgi:gliding motility-associated peptidyl-prolyl isomerase